MFERGKITQKGDGNFALVNSTVNIVTPRDEIQKLLHEGKYLEATALFQQTMRSIQAQHPVYPHWRYEMQMQDGQAILSHVPNYPEAVEKYPMRGNIRFVIPENYRRFRNLEEMLKTAYGRQEEIEIDVLSLRTWIGDHLIDEKDSSQVGDIKAVLKPKPFPDPVPMKLYIKDSHYSVDYLEIGVTRIEGQIITLENSKQDDAKIYVKLVLDLTEGRSTFSIKIPDRFSYDVEANLLFNQFLFEVNSGKKFAIKMLKQGNDLFVSEKWTLDDKLPENTGEFIHLLIDLLRLQESFDVTFNLSESIDEEDLENIYLMKLSVEGKARTGTYTDYKIHVSDRESITNIIELNDKSPSGNTLTMVSQGKTITLLGAVITFNEYQLEFQDAVLKNSDIVKKKLELMDEGESISLQFVPASDERNKFLEKYIP